MNALFPAASGVARPPPGPRLYHGPEHPDFQDLRRRLEGGWVEQLRQAVAVPKERLPLLWDCDFMFGEPAGLELVRYVLCEVNVSSVAPLPPSAIRFLLEAMRLRFVGNSRIAMQVRSP